MKTSNKRLILFTVSFALFMDVLDSNIINTSIPMMAQSLNVNPIDLKIALISYLLSLAVFIPISGWAADKYGTKRIFIAAFGVFTLSSFFCGYARTLTELVIARSIQGMGGAFMISLGRLIVARTFKRHELVTAMNTVIIVVAVAVMIGPFIGGFITQHWSWPWIFWVNLPIGILAMLLAFYSLKDTQPKKVRPLDFLGFILFGGSLALLCFSLSELSESNLDLNVILLWLVISVFMMIFYFIHSKPRVHRIMKVELFRIRTFRISVLGNLCARLGFGGMPFLLPLLLQLGLNYSAQLSGLLLMPMAFGIVFSKLLSLTILRGVGYRRYLIINTLLVAIILWTFQIINMHTSIYAIAFLTFIFGIALSAQMTAMNSLAFADINEDDLSASTSITSTVQVLAQSLGVAVGAILLRFFLSLSTQPLALSPAIFHQTFLAMGFLTIFSCIIFIHLQPNDGKQMLIKESTMT
jgi:EmrB/QacA subfamily drug resistance transporter